MRNVIIAGYLASALLYLAARVNPRGGVRSGLVDWVSITKLALAEAFVELTFPERLSR